MCAVDPHTSHSVTFTPSCSASGMQRSLGQKSALASFPGLHAPPPADQLNHLLVPSVGWSGLGAAGDPTPWLPERVVQEGAYGVREREACRQADAAAEGSGGLAEFPTARGRRGQSREEKEEREEEEEEEEEEREKDPSIRCCVVDEEVLPSWGSGGGAGRTWLPRCWGGGGGGDGAGGWAEGRGGRGWDSRRDLLPAWTSEAHKRLYARGGHEADVPLLMEALPLDSRTTAHDSLRSWPEGRSTTTHDSSWLSGPYATVNSPDDNNNHLRDVVVKGDFSAEKRSLRCPLLSDYSTLLTDSTWIFEGHETSQQKPLIMSLLTTTVSKLKTFYRRCKHPRRRASCRECKNSREEIRTSPPCQWGGGARGRQHGDKPTEGKQGHRWWHSSRASKGGSRERGKGRSASHDGGGTVHTHSSGAQASSSNFLRKSLDTEYRGKQRRLRGQHRSRPVSTDDEGSDEVFESPPKYRDKPPRSKVSSKSEDTAQNSSKVSQKKSLQRNRSLSRSRLEGASRRMERDDSKPRRRLSHRKIKSSSSSSSSSSRSSSPTKSRPASRSKSQLSKRKAKLTNGSLDREDFSVHQTSPEQYQADLVQHQTDFVQNNADPVPHRTNFKVKDNTTDFLSRLDSVLSDLVEHEKKRISKFGQKNARGSVSKGAKNGSSERPQKAAEHRRNKGKKSDGGDKSASPSLQQLRTTLKAVRVKKRAPVPSDVLEKHSDYFTESLPHQPRILKSHQRSQLLSQRCYQPPRRKQKPAPQDSSSDLYTSPAEDEHEEVKQVCEKQNDVSSEEPEEYRETSEPSDSTYEREDGDVHDMFYRAEKPGKGGGDGYYERDQSTSDEHNYRRNQSAKGGSSVAARGVIKDLTSSSRGEAGDSGDFSVDSAYTGSRGATPESVLNPGVKPRRPGTTLANRRPASSASRHRLPVKARLEDQHLVEVKRVIMRDIRESGLYSDDSINALLERHRSRWPQLSRREMEHVVRSIQDDLGVKPHATHYVCQILAAAESGVSGTPGITKKTVEGPLCVSPLGEKATKAQTKTGDAAVHPERKDPSATQTLDAKEANVEEGGRQPKKDLKEIEDEVWARSVMSGVDPGLVDLARKEATAPRLEDDNDLPAYVMDLCQQFDVKI